MKEPKMAEKLITIIIPLYNEEKNISCCLDILEQQTSQNFSVIFVDDGSTDLTYDKLLSELTDRSPSFSHNILQQANQGAAKARETGIYRATTPYVFTFDADDHITPDLIEKTEADINVNHSDISLPDFQIQQKDGSFNLLHYPDNKEQFTGIECLRYTLGKWLVPGIMCVKKEIFIKSYELYKQYNPQDCNYMNNDEVVNRLNYLHAKKVTRSHATYSYLCNPDSTTKRVNPNRYLMANNVVILYKLFGQGEGVLSQKTQEEYINVLWGLIKYLRRNRKELPNVEAWRKQIKELIHQIKPDLSKFKGLSFKSRSRLWLSLLFSLFI